MLRNSLRVHQPVERLDLLSAVERPAPRWPSSLVGFEEFSGQTVLAGMPGVGKSVLAIGSALEAALNGWNVIYFNAEMDRRALAQRVKRYLSATARPVAPALAYFHPFALNVGCDLDSLVQCACMEITRDTERLLIVVDSINSFGDLGAQAGSRDELGLNLLRKLVVWSMQVRKMTEGEIAFLLVSELNAAGGMKGRLEWKADVVLKLAQGDREGLVEVNCLKNRDGAKKELGTYRLLWEHGRLVRT
jgi:predicted ATP-dependent serine protease